MMKRFGKTKSVIYSRFISLYIKIKKIYGFYERFILMYVPFISSVLYCINIYIFKENSEAPMFLRYNANLSGHSIFWLQAFLSRSKNMCIWYKGAIILAIISHVINLMYYHGFVNISMYISISFSVTIISIISWLIFRVTYKATKTIHSECKRLE